MNVMTDAELTILSLVAESPRQGHEIQHIIDERGLRDWLPIGFSSIYYILNKLEKQKMIKGSFLPAGTGAARKRYELTDAGRGILQTAIANRLRDTGSSGTGFDLALLNLGVLQPLQVYRMLLYRQQDIKRQLTMLSKAWEEQQAKDTISVSSHALYTRNIAMLEAEADWLAIFLDHWQNTYPAVTATDADELDDPAKTQLHQITPPDRAKRLQKLKRPAPPPQAE